MVLRNQAKINYHPPTDAAGDSPYVSGINQTSTTADATTQQLLFGLDGEGGFIPGAMQAAESTFFNPDGTPRVVDQEGCWINARSTKSNAAHS